MIPQILVCAFLGQQVTVPSVALDAPTIFKRVASSVVVIRVTTATTVSLGSGVVIGPGRVATNAHVVGDATVAVLSQGDRTWRTSSIWRDKAKDIALLTVDEFDLAAPEIGSVEDVEVGAHVYVVGAPRGLEFSLSDGLVAGLRGEVGNRLLQVTAPISRGSSGGGVFDDHGRLIGLATLILKDSQNLNFALPIDWVVPPSNGRAPRLGELSASGSAADGGAAVVDGLVPDEDVEPVRPSEPLPTPPEAVALRKGFEKILSRLQVLRTQVPKLAAFLSLPHLAAPNYEGKRHRKARTVIEREAHDLFPASHLIDLRRFPAGEVGQTVLEIDIETETDAAKLRGRVDEAIKGVKEALACARDVEHDGKPAWSRCSRLSGVCPERVGAAAGNLYYWRTVDGYALVKDAINSADDLPEEDKGPWKVEANSKFGSIWATEGTSAAAQTVLKEEREVRFAACRAALHFMGAFRETAILLDWEHQSPRFYSSVSLKPFQSMCTVPKETEETRRRVLLLSARFPEDRALKRAAERVSEDCDFGVGDTCNHVLQIRDKWALEYFDQSCSTHRATVADIQREAERLGRVGTEVEKEEHLLLADRIEACVAAYAAGYRWQVESLAAYECRPRGR